MAAKSTKSQKSVRYSRSASKRGGLIPRKVYKFTKQGRNGGEVTASERRDRRTYDYSDEM